MTTADDNFPNPVGTQRDTRRQLLTSVLRPDFVLADIL